MTENIEQAFVPDPDRFDGTNPYGSEHHSGKPCVERGCSEPAGTWWTHLWCAEHDKERRLRIGRNLEAMVNAFG